MLYSPKQKKSSPFLKFRCTFPIELCIESRFLQGRSRLLANSARDAECLGQGRLACLWRISSNWDLKLRVCERHGYNNFGRKLMWGPGIFRICRCRYTNSLCLWSCLWEPFHSLQQVPAKRLFKCTQDSCRFISWVNGFLFDRWGVKSGTNVLSQTWILLWNIVMFHNTGGSCAVVLLFVSFL